MSGPRHFGHGRWECRDCPYVTTRGVDAYISAERHSRANGHAMTYVDVGSYQRPTS